MHKFYILKDKEIVEVPHHEHLEWFVRNAEERFLKQDNVLPYVEVSTVFIGVASVIPGITNRGPFETMVFGGEWNGYSIRSWSYDDALTAHQTMIEQIFEVTT